MTAAKAPARRCAVYTRKSSEEGLEQGFNSLDAQREACEAYIRSQVGEGWKLVATAYDDGGFSGGTMERPALARLLDDIRSRRIDTVVVYKVDRLTRSLANFAKIVEVFDASGVSFVSVTQQFNTTTSMGRLTLNMLLSFAQFEREVTGERIRDKIAASKQKGMWMGGFVPLGYEPDGRTLVINEAEAETVRTVFRLYLDIGNVRLVKKEADRLSLSTKIRKTSSGQSGGGRPLSRGYIYKLLNNPLYIGRIAHRGKTYDGQHPAIVDRATWDATQAKLATNTHDRSATRRVTEPSLLAGKLFDETGIAMTPSHAVKSGRRYRYYVSRHLVRPSAYDDDAESKAGWRLPAREIEQVVRTAVSEMLANRSSLAQAARDAGIAADRIGALLSAASQWNGDVLDLVEHVDLRADAINLVLSLEPLTGHPETTIHHTRPTRLKRRGVEMRLVIVDAANPSAKADPALNKAVARAHGWWNDLVTGNATSVEDIARGEGINARYVGHLLPLAFLAPDIVDAIAAGNQPAHLTAEALIRRTVLPSGWAEQRVLLGFN